MSSASTLDAHRAILPSDCHAPGQNSFCGNEPRRWKSDGEAVGSIWIIGRDGMLRRHSRAPTSRSLCVRSPPVDVEAQNTQVAELCARRFLVLTLGKPDALGRVPLVPAV
jgi:hypothetical protein